MQHTVGTLAKLIEPADVVWQHLYTYPPLQRQHKLTSTDVTV